MKEHHIQATVLQEDLRQANSKIEALQGLLQEKDEQETQKRVHVLNHQISRLQTTLHSQQTLLDSLSNPDTLLLTLDTLLHQQGKQERGFQFATTALNNTKQSCPAVSGDLQVGFAANFFVCAIVNSGEIVGLSEGNPVTKYRSVLCEGSLTGNQCVGCRTLSSIISGKKSHNFSRGDLGQYTNIQLDALKEAKPLPHPNFRNQ